MAKKAVVEPVEAVETAPAGWVKVRALEQLAGGDRIVAKGDEYWQPPEAAAFMASQGWIEIVAEQAAAVEAIEEGNVE